MVLDRKTAFIHLNDGSVEITPVSLDLRRKFLGGRGINMYLLSKSYSPGLDPFSPENPLIFGAGLLTGTLGFGSRMNITIEMTDERLPKSFALGMATSTRGACHMRSRPSLDILGLPEEVLKKIYGGPVSDRFSSYSGKGRMVWWHELLNAVCDALGFCRFLTVFSSPHAPQYKQFSKLIALSTGLTFTPNELRAVGERIYTLERMMLIKDGISRQDDTLPNRYFNEPIPEGPAHGEAILRREFDNMLDEYYRLHGWDKDGIPKRENLERLGLVEQELG